MTMSCHSKAVYNHWIFATRSFPLTMSYFRVHGWSVPLLYIHRDSHSHLAISTNYSDNLIKRRLVPPIMLAAQLSITLSIHGERYQNLRSKFVYSLDGHMVN